MLRCTGLIILAALASAQPRLPELLEAKTLEELRRFDAACEGALGVGVLDLETGRSFALNGDTVFPQASVIKIPVMVAVYRAARAGKLSLTAPITLTSSDSVPGSGTLDDRLRLGPVTLTLRELVAAMIVESDNSATNKCIELVGMDEVNRMLTAGGFPKTRLLRKMMDAEAVRGDRENLSTPNEMARLMEQIYRARIVHTDDSREMIETLKRVAGGIRQGLPLDIASAAKIGEIPGARSETGIVFLPHRPFIISVMSAYIDDRRPPVAEATRIVYRLFDKLERANAWGHTIR